MEEVVAAVRVSIFIENPWPVGLEGEPGDNS